VNTSSHGLQEVACSQRPWMNSTGVDEVIRGFLSGGLV
jgi:hypothetical protein